MLHIHTSTFQFFFRFVTLIKPEQNNRGQEIHSGILKICRYSLYFQIVVPSFHLLSIFYMLLGALAHAEGSRDANRACWCLLREPATFLTFIWQPCSSQENTSFGSRILRVHPYFLQFIFFALDSNTGSPSIMTRCLATVQSYTRTPLLWYLEPSSKVPSPPQGHITTFRELSN